MMMVDTTNKPKPTMCFLTDQFIVGGVEKVLAEAIRCLSKDFSITVEVMFGNTAPEMCDSLKDYAEIHIHHCNKYDMAIFALPVIGGYYLQHVLGRKYDYIIVVKPHFIMASFGSAALKTIFWNHGDKDIMYDMPNLSSFRKLNKLRLRMGYQKFDAVWVLTDSIKERIERAFSLMNISVLHNPVDTVDIITKGNLSVPDIKRKQNSINIVTVSRLSEEKGTIRLLQAIHSLRREIPCFLTIIGDGPCRTELEEFVASNSMQDMVVFTGTKSNPYPYVKQADLFVLSSYTELFGLVLLEAMLLETEVVATETTGSISVIRNGEHGILVNNSIEGICDGIRQYHAVGMKDHKIIQQAKARAMEFDKVHFYDEIHRLLSDVGVL